jgi:transposase-like protein
MPGRIPRSARVPHAEKRPERCPQCGSTAISRKGTRRKKIEIVQLWRCASCKRVFTPTPAALRNKTYPLRIVLDAITQYDLGYSLEATADKMKSRHGYRVGRSTIGTWLAEHRSLTTYARLRDLGRRLFPPTQAIRSIKLYHRQIYKIARSRERQLSVLISSTRAGLSGVLVPICGYTLDGFRFGRSNLQAIRRAEIAISVNEPSPFTDPFHI